jgi:dimethylargininase
VSLIAITRCVSATLGQCELTHLERRPIDVRIARQQHKEYESLLLRLGATVRSLPADDAYPDAIFVEDTALVLDSESRATAATPAAELTKTSEIAAQ